MLTAAKALFVKEYGADLKRAHVVRLDSTRFDATFDALIRKLDTGSSRQSEPDSEGTIELTPPSSSAGDDGPDEPPPPPNLQVKQSVAQRKQLAVLDDVTSAETTRVPTLASSRASTPSQTDSHLVTGKAGPGKTSRRGRKAQAAFSASAAVSSGDEGPLRNAKSGKNSTKSKRTWTADGMAEEGDDDLVLDYSSQPAASGSKQEKNLDVDGINASQMGSRTGKGQFVLKDLDDEVDAILASSMQEKAKISRTSDEPDSSILGSASSRLTGLFRNVVGGKTLTKQDLQKPLQQMQNHLLEKNVAREAAERLCTSVETDLLNHKTASFTSIDHTIRESMAKALTRILTPTSSLDLLRNITSTISGADAPARPYVISIVGVNGVGKSTSLSKIAYFLLQNKFRVLVVAADTFRSGAVEQLRVHVRNLSELSRRENVGTVDLFEKGYGKDAASLARDAVVYATNQGKGEMLYDVVLIDTAGRRHNDSRLMSSLTKFGQLANPDKIFMVGEALVGTDSVAQARNFAKEFVDTRGQLRNNGIGMDGFIISKCDTVGDMVGTLVSMVHATSIPVVFLGVGQHYGDLRGLNVGWAVDKLMNRPIRSPHSQRPLPAFTASQNGNRSQHRWQYPRKRPYLLQDPNVK
nr:signal recognition particle receptor subunit alpha like [Quercus suber]